jgi:hypothetical protein
MKRFIAFLALSISISATVFAQAAKESAIMRQNGKMMVIKDGQVTEMKENITTANGHIFRTDGTVVMNTGTSVELKDGEKMDMNGNKIPNKSFNKANSTQKATRQ